MSVILYSSHANVLIWFIARRLYSNIIDVYLLSCHYINYLEIIDVRIHVFRDPVLDVKFQHNHSKWLSNIHIDSSFYPSLLWNYLWDVKKWKWCNCLNL